MKQSLQLKLSQHLALTPQLQQSIRLLQLSSLEFNQEIEQALQDNPLLERDDGGDEGPARHGSSDALSHADASNAASGDDSAAWDNDGAPWPASGNHGPRDANDENDSGGDLMADAVGLRDHLLNQVLLSQFSSIDQMRVAFLIEALDDDGYLSQTLEDLIPALPDDLSDAEDPEEVLEQLSIALRHLQSLDPAGVGARNPRECLLLQLDNQTPSPSRELARRIVAECLEMLAARDYSKIQKRLGCNDNQLRDAQTLIKSLNPRPGSGFSRTETRYIIPDVVVRKVRGEWRAQLNQDAMPRLRVNRLYADLLRRQRGGAGNLGGLVQEARWLIKNVQQRFDTIARVSQAIVERQRGFFEHGEMAMRPLTLREIAAIVELHESTISRVTTQKFLACPRGIFELKFFFGSHVATDTGGAASSTAIRALIKQIIGAENGHKPLPDSRIANLLGEQGIVVARRTVAKYRESMNIPPVNLRKTL